MKKTYFAIALLLLLLAATLVNVWYLDGFISDLVGYVDTSRTYVEAEDYDGAERKLRQAIDEWNGADGYTHVLIRHSEIDSTTDAFYELLSDIVSGDGDSAVGSFEKLTAHLTSIATMEYVTFGSIF
jgi:hypothetical protein